MPSEITNMHAVRKGNNELFPQTTSPSDFQTVINNVEDYAIILLDKNGIVTSWNKGAQKIKGYTADEIIGKTFKLFYTNEEREEHAPDNILALASKTGRANYEGWRVRNDGRRFWGCTSLTANYDQAGEVVGFVKITRDLTNDKIAADTFSNYVEELKSKNEQLKQSEERYHKMVLEVRDYVIILLSKEGKVLDWNKGAEKIKGYKPNEIIGKSFKLFYSKEDKDAGLPGFLLSEAEKHGSIVHEGWRIRKDGTRFWGSVTLTALHNEQNEIFGFSKVTRDLTDKKISEDQLNKSSYELKFKNEELKRSEERYHKMIDEVQDYAIILLDKNGIIQNWNIGAEFIKGYKDYEIVGRSFENFYLPEDRDKGFPQKLLSIAVDKGRVTHEGWRVRKDGTRFWGNVVITALHNSENEIVGFSKVTRDLSAKKEADDLLKKNAEELEQKNKTLIRLNEEVSSFAYVASHDLKEPLRKIQTFGSRVMESDNIADIKKYIDKIRNSAARMQKLMDDLMSYSLVTNDTSNKEQINLNDVLQTTKNELELQIAEKGAEIIADNLPIINGICFQLEQLFINLLSNALKFAKADELPIIKIGAEIVSVKDLPLSALGNQKRYYKIIVSDNGIGFEDDEAKKIFEVFNRLHSNTEYKGTGIGLAIVKKIVENHEGIVVAHGQPGVGATFELYFPIIDWFA